MYRLMAVIRGLRQSTKDQELIVGNVASGWTPVRNPQSKYFITEDQYSEASYPPFVTGPSYLVSRSAVNHLFAAAMEHPFLHLEDVFLTGFAAENCVISRFHCDGFHPQAVRFTDLKETDILWHYLSGKSLGHMQRIFKYEELLQEYQKSQQEIVQLKKEHRNDC